MWLLLMTGVGSEKIPSRFEKPEQRMLAEYWCYVLNIYGGRRSWIRLDARNVIRLVMEIKGKLVRLVLLGKRVIKEGFASESGPI